MVYDNAVAKLVRVLAAASLAALLVACGARTSAQATHNTINAPVRDSDMPEIVITAYRVIDEGSPKASDGRQLSQPSDIKSAPEVTARKARAPRGGTDQTG